MSDNQSEHEGHESHGTRHMVLMMLCCLLPIVAVIVVAAVFPGVSYLSFLFVLVCPLSMMLMMIPDAFSKKKKTNGSCH